MIVSIQSARDVVGGDIPESILIRKIRAIERLIRDETNNNFQDPRIRFYADAQNNVLLGSSPYLLIGDTIEINDSVNNGIYMVVSIENGITIVDRTLLPSAKNMVTKIVYPESIQEGVLNMLQWDFNMRPKMGIKSESLSRHSVTYYDMDVANSLDGYPVSLVGFLEPYYKMRF